MAQVWQDALEDLDAVDVPRGAGSIRHVPSLDALEQLYTELSQWESTWSTRRPLDGRDRARRSRADVHRPGARLWSQFDDIDEAVRCLNEILLLDSNPWVASRTWSASSWTRSVSGADRHLRALRAGARGDPARCGMLLKMAEAYVDLLDVPRAIDTYRRVLELEPSHTETLGRLGALYEGEALDGRLRAYERLAAEHGRLPGARYRPFRPPAGSSWVTPRLPSQVRRGARPRRHCPRSARSSGCSMSRADGRAVGDPAPDRPGDVGTGGLQRPHGDDHLREPKTLPARSSSSRTRSGSIRAISRRSRCPTSPKTGCCRALRAHPERQPSSPPTSARQWGRYGVINERLGFNDEAGGL